jgi:hypothetical protein
MLATVSNRKADATAHSAAVYPGALERFEAQSTG